MKRRTNGVKEGSRHADTGRAAGGREPLRALGLVALGASASAWIHLQIDSSIVPTPPASSDSAVLGADAMPPAAAFDSPEQTLARLNQLRVPAALPAAPPAAWADPIGAARPRAERFRPPRPGTGPTFP
jgi:hypothetical protein